MWPVPPGNREEQRELKLHTLTWLITWYVKKASRSENAHKRSKESKDTGKTDFNGDDAARGSAEAAGKHAKGLEDTFRKP